MRSECQSEISCRCKEYNKNERYREMWMMQHRKPWKHTQVTWQLEHPFRSMNQQNVYWFGKRLERLTTRRNHRSKRLLGVNRTIAFKQHNIMLYEIKYYRPTVYSHRFFLIWGRSSIGLCDKFTTFYLSRSYNRVKGGVNEKKKKDSITRI